MNHNDFTFSINASQQLCVAGSIDLGNVKEACAAGANLIHGLSSVQVDLSGINYADSSSLAMLVDWIRVAKEQHKDIKFMNMPQFMLDLGRVCGLDAILPIGKSLEFHN